MDPRLKSQDTVFEVLEKGNFIAPPGGDDRDLEDIPVLRRAMAFLLPGSLLALLLPGIFGGLTLIGFLGALLLIFGYLRLASESLWFQLSATGSVLQALVLAFCFIAETTIPAWKALPIYGIALVAASVLAALAPSLMVFGLRTRKNCLVPAAVLALCAIAITVLQLAAILTAARIALAVVGAGMLVWLLLIAIHGHPHPMEE